MRHWDTKKDAKIRYNPTKHHPNKDESKVLRKLKIITGLSEEEIRKNKEYRKQLAEAGRNGRKPNDYIKKKIKYCKNMIKYICKKTGLAREHPETLKLLDEKLKQTSNIYFRDISAKKLIEFLNYNK